MSSSPFYSVGSINNRDIIDIRPNRQKHYQNQNDKKQILHLGTIDFENILEIDHAGAIYGN
jgi:hypothetical protein